MIRDLFGRLPEEKGRVYPSELNRLLANAGHAPATREEMNRAAGLATDPAAKARGRRRCAAGPHLRRGRATGATVAASCSTASVGAEGQAVTEP